MKKVLTTITVLLPLLIYYKISVLGLAVVPLLQLIMLLLVVFITIKQKGKLNLSNSKKHSFLMIWIIFITFIVRMIAPYSHIASENTMNFIFFIITAVTLFLGFSGAFDYSYGLKIYSYTVTFLSLFLVVQVIFYYILKMPLSGRLPFLELKDIYTYSFNYLSVRIGGINPYARFSSLFSEPSHFAIYTIPFLVMKLFGYGEVVKKNIKVAVILSILIVISASGNGIVLLGIVWGGFYLSTGNKGIFIKLIKLFISIIILYLAYYALLNIPFTSEVVGNLFTSSGEDANSKAAYRIYRGFAMFYELPFIHQLFGVGYRNLTVAAEYYMISTKFDVEGATFEYMNGTAQFLVYSGLIGLTMYVWMLKTFFNKSRLSGKILILSFFALTTSSAIFMDETTWQLYLLLIIAGFNKPANIHH